MLHDHVLARIVDRIETEPDLLERSIRALREDDGPPPEILAELGPLESEPRIVRQVSALGRGTVATMDDLDPDAFRLAVHYLVRRIVVYGPSLPLDEQVRIVWRVPEQDPRVLDHAPADPRVT
ncbi:hypothetical protein ABZ896_06910 [Streptomyces sp. NPDC047072]|uniref:hypothetical protein n=1 Tax=Streptomyces sp. NPDC047072 TaxID=3154809 RepID=UPI0033E88D79